MSSKIIVFRWERQSDTDLQHRLANRIRLLKDLNVHIFDSAFCRRESFLKALLIAKVFRRDPFQDIARFQAGGLLC